MGYAREEQETTCIYDYLSDNWMVYRNVRKHITKLLHRFGEPEWKEEEGGRIIAARWRAGGKQVRFARNSAESEGFEDEEDQVV